MKTEIAPVYFGVLDRGLCGRGIARWSRVDSEAHPTLKPCIVSPDRRAAAFNFGGFNPLHSPQPAINAYCSSLDRSVDLCDDALLVVSNEAISFSHRRPCVKTYERDSGWCGTPGGKRVISR